MSNIFQITVHWHICRRMSPIPRIIGAVVCVKHVISRFLEVLCCPFALLHSSSYLGILFPRQCAFLKILCLRNNRVPKRNGIIRSARFLDSFDDPNRKAIAVFEGSSPFIGTMIRISVSELIQQIPFMESSLSAAGKKFWQSMNTVICMAFGRRNLTTGGAVLRTAPFFLLSHGEQ